MKDVTEFTKLFKVNIPYKPEWEYYVSTLQLSNEYKGLSDLVEDFSRFEEWVENQGYSSIRSYKMKCLDQLVDHVKNTLAYQDFEDVDYSNFKFRTLDNMKGWSYDQSKSDNPDYLLSFDLSSANFNTIKEFDWDNSLGDNWEGLCEKFFVHKTLVRSKSFRQVVFGNLNPKRNGKLQLMKILSVVDHLEKIGYGDKVVSINNDEVCISLPVELVEGHGFQDVIDEDFGLRSLLNVPTKATVYAVKWMGSGIFKKVILFQDGLDKEDRYTTLSGVPGNKFYRYFKTEILNQEIDERDLYFVNDGDLAKWIL